VSVFDVMLFLHILAGTAWFGGVIYQEAMLASAGRSKDMSKVDMYLLSHRVNNRVFPAAAVVILVTALYLILDSDLVEWTDPWIIASFGLFAVAIIMSVGFFRPEGDRLAELVEGRGAANNEVQRRFGRVVTMARVQAFILFVLLLMMVWRPS